MLTLQRPLEGRLPAVGEAHHRCDHQLGSEQLCLAVLGSKGDKLGMGRNVGWIGAADDRVAVCAVGIAAACAAVKGRVAVLASKWLWPVAQLGGAFLVQGWQRWRTAVHTEARILRFERA